MRASPVYDEEIYKFLKIKSLVLGVLEIVAGSVASVSLLITGSWIVVFPVLYILTGFLTVFAACKPKLCLVRTSQTFNFINILTIITSLRYFLTGFTRIFGLIGIILMVCDFLVLIFSIIVASTCCSSCCKPKSRGVACSDVSTAVPLSSIGLLNHPDTTASPQSVVFVIPSAPPPYNSLDLTATPTFNSSVLTAPPPAYDQVILQ